MSNVPLKTDDTEKNHKLLLLAECFLFRHLDLAELTSLVDAAGLALASAQDVIIQQYDQTKEMYIIVSGKVSITTTSDEGKELSFGVLGEGNIFGEMALFDNKERSATITALESCKFLVIKQMPFIRFISQNPKVALKFLAAMSVRIRFSNQNIEEKYFGLTHVRLAKKIFSLAKIYGHTENDDITISIKLSHSDLAKSVGISTDSVSRQLATWQTQEILSYHKGTLRVRDIDRIKALIESPNKS